MIDDEEIEYSKKGRLLGLIVSQRGITPHVTERINKGKVAVAKLKRFKRLPEKIKIHLYKTLIRPILEYPSIPLITLHKSKLQKLQSLQYKYLRFASGQVPPYHETVQSIHFRIKRENTPTGYKNMEQTPR